MMRGLVHETESGPQVTAAYTATTADDLSGGNSTGSTAANADTAAAVTSTGDPGAFAAVDSHLDSFFAGSGWTREDVLVVAALVQLVAWSILLYNEVVR